MPSVLHGEGAELHRSGAGLPIYWDKTAPKGRHDELCCCFHPRWQGNRAFAVTLVGQLMQVEQAPAGRLVQGGFEGVTGVLVD